MNLLLKLLFLPFGYLCLAVSAAMEMVSSNRAGWVVGVPIYPLLELQVRTRRSSISRKKQRPFRQRILTYLFQLRERIKPRRLAVRPESVKEESTQ